MDSGGFEHSAGAGALALSQRELNTEQSIGFLPAGLLIGGLLAISALLVFRRPGRPTPAAGSEFRILLPPDHEGPAHSMLSELARSGALAAPGPRLFGGARPAAFGRAVRIGARRISYRDYAAGPFAGAHRARLEHLYPGIRVDFP